MVDIIDASLVYKNGTQGLDNASITINDGELCFVVGRSGSGKSTLTKLIIGELKPTVGEIHVNGFNMGKLGRRKKARARRTIGMVFQDYRLISSMTVYENLEFAMRCVGTRPAIIESRIYDVLEMVDLEDKAYSYPTELSGGEQQRVAIARALINRPALIIADEPTGNLDVGLSEDIMRLLVHINNKLGTTVIVVSHARDLVNEVYNSVPARVIELEEGKIIGDFSNRLSRKRA